MKFSDVPRFHDRAVCCSLVLAWLSWLAASAAAQPGALDAAFTADGGVESGAVVNSIAVQPDGRVLIAGTFASVGGIARIRVARLLPDGSLDHSFDPGAGPNTNVQCVALDREGRILIAGLFTNVSGMPRAGVARLHPDGSLDAGFVPSLTGQSNPSLQMYAVAAQPDGKVVCGGYRLLSLRLNVDGSQDSSYPIHTSNSTHITFAIAVQDNGRILVAGSHGLNRFLPNGAADRSFDGDGFVSIGFFDSGQAILPLPGGDLIVTVGFGPRIFRVTRQGRIDSGFNVGTGPDAGVYALAAQPDGKILLSGNFTSFNEVPRPRIARLNPDGSLDMNFIPTGPSNSPVNAIAVDAAGGILVGGAFAELGGVTRQGIARLEGDPVSVPMIVLPPVSQSVFVDQDVRFSVTAGGVPLPAYQWLFNDQPIADATGPALLLINARSTNVGAYSVFVSNAHGSVTSVVATLSVNPWPVEVGRLDASFDPGRIENGSVLVVVEQPDGCVIIGGTFTEVQGRPRLGLARLQPDGALDLTFDPGMNDNQGARPIIKAVALGEDGRIYVGGNFTQFGSLSRTNLVRLLPNGAVDTAFNRDNPDETSIHALVVQSGGKVIAGGMRPGFLKPFVRRYLADGIWDPSFNERLFLHENSPLDSLAVDRHGNVFVGGQFNYIGGVIKLDSNGNFLATSVYYTRPVRLALQGDGKVLAATKYDVFRLHSDLSVDLKIESTSIGISNHAVQAHTCGKILVGGVSLVPILGEYSNLLRFQPDGSLDPSFSRQQWDGTVHAICLASNRGIFVGGEFRSVAGASRFGLVKLQDDPPQAPVIVGPPPSQSVRAGIATTVSVTADCPDVTFQWQFNGTNIPGAVEPSLSFVNTRITNDGHYTMVVSTRLGTTVSTPIHLDVETEPMVAGSLDHDFFPTGNWVRVNCLAMQPDGRLLAGGGFNRANGAPANRLARLNPDGTIDGTFQPNCGGGLDGEVLALALQSDGKILLGGSFRTWTNQCVFPPMAFGYFYQSSAARLYPGGEMDQSFAPIGSLPNFGISLKAVTSVAAQPDGKVLLGGAFDFVDNVEREGLARVLPDGRLDTNFVPPSFQSLVNAVALQPDGRVLVGGAFIVSGPGIAPGLARLNPDGSSDADFHPETGVYGVINALALMPDGRIVVGGLLNAAGGIRRNVARLLPDGSLDATFNPGTGPSSDVRAVLVQPDGKVVIGGSFVSVNGVSKARLARLNADGSLDPTFDSGTGPNFQVHALAATLDAEVCVGGSFTTFDGRPRRGLVRVNGDLRFLRPEYSPAGFNASVSTLLGRTYWLEFKTSLSETDWTPLTSLVGDGSAKLLQDTTQPVGQRFYRVRAD